MNRPDITEHVEEILPTDLTVGAIFPTSADSPFADGYDIASDRDALADLVAPSEPDVSEPRSLRLAELQRREAQLRAGSGRSVASGTASRVKPQSTDPDPLGALFDEVPDTMTLHTKEAYGLFTGRASEKEVGVTAISGGRRFAAMLKSIWYLSSNDNPYADWALIRIYDALLDFRGRLAQTARDQEDQIARLQRRGLALSLLSSRRPKLVTLGFRSPYGYTTAEAFVDYDYYVRMVKTLVRKDQLSDQEGRTHIRRVGRQLRALLLEPVRWEKYLLRDELRALSRSDFLPGADALAKRRVQAAVAMFGEVPRKVFAGAVLPRHTRRRVKLSEAELRLLREVSLSACDEPPESDAQLV